MNLTESGNGAARVKIVNVTVGTGLKQIFVILYKVGVEVSYP